MITPTKSLDDEAHAECPQCHPHRRLEGNLAIDASDVHVTLQGTRALRGVNLQIPRGEVVALIGPNGSGKTTLLRALLGLQRIDRGQIRILGQQSPKDALSRIGYVPQRLLLERSFILSVREFLALRLRKTRHWFWQHHRVIDKLVCSTFNEIGIEPLLDRPVAHLSGGQLQRVLIAFSLLNDPDLLLLDEP